jgi:hypothetical protein
MSINRESDNFDQLRRLLTIKRYEQPPPGYFHSFSRQIIVRLKAGELGDSPAAKWWVIDGSWLHRLWTAFETRPAFAGSLGVAVCGFFVAGALLVESNDAAAVAQDTVRAPQPIAVQASVTATIPDPDFPNILRVSTTEMPRTSLFDRSPTVRWMPATPVNFTVPQN